MALTDLTGTTWTLNDALTSYAGGSHSVKTYNVNMTTDTALHTHDGDASTFVVFEVGYDSGGECNVALLYTSTTTSFSNRAMLATGHDTKSLPDTWASGKFSGTFTIIGGTDATNSDLIAWIEDNCTNMTPPTPDVVVTYEGGNIVELSEAGTKTLKTAGMYLTDDIILAYSGGSGGGGGGTAKTVKVTLSNPKNASMAQDPACILYESDTVVSGEATQIGSISSPSGEATVTMTKLILRAVFFSDGFISHGLASSLYGVNVLRDTIDDGFAFFVEGDGEIKIDSMDYDD